MLSVIETSCFP